MAIVKQMPVKVEIEIHKMLNEIVKKTGESKKDIIVRLIKSDHKRITEGQSIPESLNKAVSSIAEKINAVSNDLPKVVENTTAIRNASNRFYSMMMYFMKEHYRSTSAMQLAFTQNKSINDNNKEMIAEESDKLAAKQFNIFMDHCKTEATGTIEDMLRKA
jgi:acyl carrier protein phosphodiesterase